MQVDKRSLIDLGILPNVAGEWPLVRLLDHTHSRPGLDALKSLLAHPLADSKQIVARQQLLRVLPTALMHVQWTTLTALSHDVHTFLDSNYIIFPSSRVDAALFVLRHRDIVDYLEQRLAAVSQLLELCGAIRDRLRAIDGDDGFAEILSVFDDMAMHPVRQSLRSAETSGSARRLALCALDHQVRVDARDVLQRVLSMLHRLDGYASLAVAAMQPAWTYPTLVAGEPYAAHQLRHPLLERGVANDVAMNADERVVFLTGPNMAGKSTLLRAIGISVHFAHVGLPVPAEAARIPVIDRLISSLSIEDNIARGESLYLAEVRRVKHVVTHVANGEHVVALLDEVFRGTNAKDATDATGLLVDGLSQVPRGLFVLASHLVEVAEARQGQRGTGWWCMHVDDADRGNTERGNAERGNAERGNAERGNPERGNPFTYVLRRGVSNVRLGMALLESEGVAGMLRQLTDTEFRFPALTEQSRRA